MGIPKTDIIQQLRKEIIALDGLRHQPMSEAPQEGLSLFTGHFPQGRFPLGAVHECLPASRADQPAALGFCLALVQTVLPPEGLIAWVSGQPAPLYGPGLKQIGIDPARVIFVQARRAADRQWAMEEVLQCPSLAAVVGEMDSLDFKQSRRLQLAAEKSGVTAFVLPSSNKSHTNAASSRWLVRSLPSLAIDDLPGVGAPLWGVELRHMRHGKPGSWEIGWADGRFTRNAGISDASTARELPEIPAARALAANGMEPYYFDDEGPAVRALAGAAALQPFPAGDLLHGFYIHEKRVYA
jgi:protein ImuA